MERAEKHGNGCMLWKKNYCAGAFLSPLNLWIFTVQDLKLWNTGTTKTATFAWDFNKSEISRTYFAFSYSSLCLHLDSYCQKTQYFFFDVLRFKLFRNLIRKKTIFHCSAKSLVVSDRSTSKLLKTKKRFAIALFLGNKVHIQLCSQRTIGKIVTVLN